MCSGGADLWFNRRMPDPSVELEVGGRKVTITNPEKVFFPETGYTKLEIVQYYLAVADGALRGVMRRPMVLKRFVNGADKEPFFQKRAPGNLPEGIETAHITFPSGRTADLVVCDDVADLAWVINLGCLDLNPWAVRANDVDHPDELRIDLDPTPEAGFAMVRELALVCREVLEDFGYKGFPKTSGSRGIHINVRIEPKWGFTEVRRCALALGREVERRAPLIATTKWWKEERHGVFIDYNQNARDRTVASAYSVRPTPDARVSCPLEWDEVRRCALALGREVERRAPLIATTKWWKEERHGVFFDYNQNARDRTVASAYSVRPTPDARVSCPLEWDEVPHVELADFTIRTVPKRYAERGDLGAGIDDQAFSLEPLLELVAKQEAEGQGDAAYPPHFPKAEGEPARVQPSKRRKKAE